MAVDLARRRILAWALYDWANSAFATTVLAGFFPVFFTDFWSPAGATDDGFRLGVTNSVAGLLVALGAPLLGAIADRGGHRRRFLAVFTGVGVLATASLAAVGQGSWEAAALLFVVAVIGFSGSITFYDALLTGIAPPGREDRVSALGYAAGYLGGGLLFLVNVTMYRRPEWFGLADGTTAVRVAFVTVAVWWALFAIPLFRMVPEPPSRAPSPPGRALWDGIAELAATFRALRRLRPVLLFLVAYWLYIDGVDTIVRMASFYGRSLGLPAASLVQALLITQFVGFPAALLFGRLGERIGTRRGIYVALGVYVAVTLWGHGMTAAWEFYALAVAIGLVQGGVQSLSRSFFLRLVPPEQAGQFFGFYNMLGKFAVVLGPLLMGVVGRATGDPRDAILAVLLLFVAGGTLLFLVDEEQARRATRG